MSADRQPTHPASGCQHVVCRESDSGFRFCLQCGEIGAASGEGEVMSDWAKTLLAETIEEIWEGDVEMTFAQRDRALAVLERRLLGLLEAAGNLAWAAGVEIQGGHRTQAFKSQHHEKIRHWIAEFDAAKAAAERP